MTKIYTAPDGTTISGRFLYDYLDPNSNALSQVTYSQSINNGQVIQNAQRAQYNILRNE